MTHREAPYVALWSPTGNSLHVAGPCVLMVFNTVLHARVGLIMAIIALYVVGSCSFTR